MTYDNAGWHDERLPPGVPLEHSGIHIALFLKWCFTKGWAGLGHTEDEPEEVKRVIDGTLSATEFFFEYCDGKLSDQNLNDEGNAFTKEYYSIDGLYLTDFGKLFGHLKYEDPESAYDFEKLSEVLESRLQSGNLKKSLIRRLWRFW